MIRSASTPLRRITGETEYHCAGKARVLDVDLSLLSD